jgi:hypothetical protein
MHLRSPVLLLALLLLGTAACTDAGAAAPPATSTGSPAATAAAAAPSPTTSVAPSGAVVATPAVDVPSRVVVAELGIDLPVVSGDLVVPGNPADYPLCDVAQYLTTYRYPGRPGTTTWVYAHAREGMFLRLLKASERADGRELLGVAVEVYSDGPTRYTYEITEVVRHATDRGLARDVPPDGGRLVLQTSEGPKGTVPKLQIAARLVGSSSVDRSAAVPAASPRVCAGA